MNIDYADIEGLVAWGAAQQARAPDFVIGDPLNPYLRRWWIIPRNRLQNVYLHEILRSDDDRALHDHPWENCSIILSGSYVEVTPQGRFERHVGDVVRRTAETAHRLEVAAGEPVLTLFFTGAIVREWGFHCPDRWVHWRDFTGGENGEVIGRGCGEHI